MVHAKAGIKRLRKLQSKMDIQNDSHTLYKLKQLLLFFFISKNRKVPMSTQDVDKGSQPNKKQKPNNYLLLNQVRNSTTEFVLSTLYTLAQAHRLDTKLALIFWSVVPSFSNTNLFLARQRVQNRHKGAASQILLRFLPTVAPYQAKRV